jgi:hypothetical protein
MLQISSSPTKLTLTVCVSYPTDEKSAMTQGTVGMYLKP